MLEGEWSWEYLACEKKNVAPAQGGVAAAWPPFGSLRDKL